MNNYQVKNIDGAIFVVRFDNDDKNNFTKIVQITSEGNLIPQNKTVVVGWLRDSQKIKSEAEAARNKARTIRVVAVCCLIALLAILYTFNLHQARLSDMQKNVTAAGPKEAEKQVKIITDEHEAVEIPENPAESEDAEQSADSDLNEAEQTTDSDLNEVEPASSQTAEVPAEVKEKKLEDMNNRELVTMLKNSGLGCMERCDAYITLKNSAHVDPRVLNKFREECRGFCGIKK